MLEEKQDILDWYKSLNEDEGTVDFTVPVPQSDISVLRPGTSSQVIEPEIEREKPDISVIVKEVDPVVEKDKGNALMAFVIAKRIQDILVRVAGLSEPYETDSETRQELTDSIKDLYKKLGENIASL